MGVTVCLGHGSGNVNRVEEAVECYRGGAACSQAVLATYAEDFGLSREQAMKVASGFAGGMRLAETCGAVTGAFMVLGLKLAGPRCAQRDGRGEIYAAVRDFAVRFKERNGTVVCRELLGCDIGTPAGARRAKEEGLCSAICPKLVQDAAGILEQML
jgi:C_GCAxxG_C_C family probable redox protein